MDFEGEQQGYDEEPRGYDRERSRSPRDDYRGNGDARARSASPNGRDHGDGRPPPPSAPPVEDEEEARNQGSNLFVTGIHPRLSEGDVAELFAKFGEVEKCNIMRDPHTRESRGFGFVNMVNADQADAAKEKLQGEVIEGRTLSIEKARRSKPRTPTPGRYFGPPKHDFRGPPQRGGRFREYDDRRGYGRRDDAYGYRSSRPSGRYEDRYESRDSYGGRGYGGSGGGAGYGGRRDRYDDRGGSGYDRYAGREDRYERRGGGSGSGGRHYEDRESRRPPPAADYQAADPAGGGRSYDDGAARYERR